MNDKLLAIWNNPRRSSVIIGVVALNVGVGIGYILGRRLKKEVVEYSQPEFNFNVDELDELRNRQAGNHPTARPRVEKVIKNSVVPPQVIEGERFVEDKIKEIVVGPIKEEIADDELVTQSIFDHPEDHWNYDEEVKNRTENQPYVIHKDEFYGEESGYQQSTLTYYSGDNILCDEDDSPVYNHELVTGPLLFGHGSGDPNVVHIRNDKRKAEYEVLFDPGLYSVDVLGLEIEHNTRVEDLKHSRHKKFRLE